MIRLPAVLVVSLVLAAAVPAQLLYTFDGDAVNDKFGASVSAAGDVDGDGFDDIVVGGPFADANGVDSGRVRVYSGFDGSVLHTLEGEAPFELFGFFVSGAGDVNGDGFDDIIVGAPFAAPSGPLSGSARVFSGLDGTMLHRFDGTGAGDSFGGSVSGAGDVDGDGHADLIVGASADDDGGADSGTALVLSGLDGSVLHALTGAGAGDAFGFSVSGAGDVDMDGFDDVLVGAPGDDDAGAESGSAVLVSGRTGAVIRTHLGDGVGEQLGFTVSTAGDVDGDGIPDQVIGSPFNVGAVASSGSLGSVRVHSGLDGHELHRFFAEAPDQAFGVSVSGAGDVDGDGFDDLIVGSPLGFDHAGVDTGFARVFSGRDGGLLIHIDGEGSGDVFGVTVHAAGDVDGDGFADVVVGADRDDNTAINAGSAKVYSGAVTAIYPGSGEDLELRSARNAAAPDRAHVKVSVQQGDVARVCVRSPAGGFDGLPAVVVGQLFVTASPPSSPAGFPEIHLDVGATPPPVVLLGGPSGPLGPLVLPPTGLTLAIGPAPPGLAGSSLIIQALSLAGAAAANGIFAASAAHELRF